ncbi:MAG: flagellar biosynthesis anti-sigma factor FlgM [Chakrabartia godavariana]
MVDPVSSSSGAPAPQIVRNPAPKPTLNSAGGPGPADVPRLFSMASKIASEGPPVDYVKLAQIRTAIAQGSYPVDTTAIAQAMSFQAYL